LSALKGVSVIFARTQEFKHAQVCSGKPAASKANHKRGGQRRPPKSHKVEIDQFDTDNDVAAFANKLESHHRVHACAERLKLPEEVNEKIREMCLT
jgi:hypothetical protein